MADLTAFALQAACWGDPDASGLALLDPPPGGAMTAARAVLTAIGAVGPDGRATERGTRLARLGLHPRLGRALLEAAPAVGPGLAAEVVALLSEEPPRDYGDDLTAALRTARRGGDAYGARWRTEVRRLRGLVPGPPGPPGESEDTSAPTRTPGRAEGSGHRRTTPPSRAHPGHTGVGHRGRRRRRGHTGVGHPGHERPQKHTHASHPGHERPQGHTHAAPGHAADDAAPTPEAPAWAGSGAPLGSGGSAAGSWAAGRGEEARVGLVVASAFPERVGRADGGRI
ncbi:hypothetical protein SHKM778_70110 [Streptomyces sp. KM77-8]|uniref:Helicase-associated domain-containing protein n=1 Tax=Streptomyces haneummycinicus TaxID=3074435 RepID=A0AAT9HTK4_9ACTN